MRKYLIFVVSLVLCLGSITAIIAIQDLQNYELRGYVDPTRTTELPYRIPRLGVNADLLQYSPNELSYHLDLMNEAGIHWIRQFIYWDEIEPEQENFRWDTLDLVVSQLSDYPQMQLIPVFMNSPAWTRQSEVVTAPPDDPTDIIPFLQAFTERYGDAITYYQVWDEPNLDDAWGMENPSPADYSALLAESYRAIHSRDLGAVVIAGALAPTTEISGRNIADDLYLQQLYDLGASDYFDAVAGKPYGFSNSPFDRDVSRDTLNFSRLILLREVMVANGDGNKQLWASHWGWNSLPDDWTGEASIWGSVTDNEQLDHTINALQRANREWAWLGGMVLHHWQPTVADDNPQWGFAVINQSDEPTALYSVLSTYDDISIAQDGLYHPRTVFADYSGLWTFSDLGADIGWLETSDSQLTFDFKGTDIALLLREGDYFAFLYPTVDGNDANATPHDANGNAYILLHSGSQTPELNIVPVSRHLDDIHHELTVVADRGEDQWALAGYAVSSGHLAYPYQTQIRVAWMSLITSLLATIVSGYFLPWTRIYSRLRGVIDVINTGMQFIITIATSLALIIGLLLSVGIPETSLFRRDLVEQGILVIVTGGLLVIELPLLVALVAVLVLFWLIYHHLEWGLYLVILYAPFFLFPVELYTYFFPMSELLILITTGAWLLHVFVEWGHARQMETSDYPIRSGIQWHVLDGLMFVWLILGCLAVTWSADKGTALTELRTLFIEPFLFYVILRSLKPSYDTFKHLIYSLVGAGVLVSVIGLFLYLTGSSVITAEGGARRLASVYGSPNNVGLFLGRVLPFVIASVIIIRGRLRYVAGCVALLLLVTVALTQSVGAILIGVPAGVATVIVLVYRRRAIPILIALAVVGLVATIGLTQVSTRFASLLDLGTGTNFIRIRVWESTIEILGRYPLTGLGLDQFLPMFSGAYVRPDAIFDPDLSHPHHIILDFWIRLGILGVVWLGLTMFTIGWRVIKVISQPIEDNQRVIFYGAIGALVALVTHGLIDNSIYVNDLAYIFVLLIAIIVHFSQDSLSDTADEVERN